MKHRYTAAVIAMLFIVPTSVTAQNSATKQMAARTELHSIQSLTFSDEQLYGTWRLVKYTRTVLATGETTNFFGNSPSGFINYGRDGRVLVLVVSDIRPKGPVLTKITDQLRAELFKTMFAYGGTYTINGKTITHHVDISSDERSGDLVREVKFEGNRIILRTPPYQWRGEQSFNELIWERIEERK